MEVGVEIDRRGKSLNERDRTGVGREKAAREDSSGILRVLRGGHSRSRNASVMALTSGMPARAIALTRALTSASGLKGFRASSSA